MTVQQYYTSQEFELPSVVFDVATERAESVELRFVVTDIEAKRVGFHPRFRSDAWAINDDRLVFEARVGPDETVTTLYALDTDDEEMFEHAMESLRIERVGAPDRGGPSLDLNLDDTVADEHSESATAPAEEPTPADESATENEPATVSERIPVDIPGDAGSEAAAVDESTRPDKGAPRADNRFPAVDDDPLTVPDPSGPGTADGETAGAGTTAGHGGDLLQSREDRDETTGQSVDRGVSGERAQNTGMRATGTETGGEGPADQPETPSSGGGESADDTDTGEGEFTEQSADGLVEELLGRIDRGELPSTARERLAEQVTEEQSGADEARLASLQARVSDIEAFSDPVEQLLEAHGPPAGVLDTDDERLAALEGLDERVSELETHAETVEEHENRIERLGQRVTALGDELDTATTQLETDVTEVETQLESLRTELERIESSAETAREEASDAGAHAGELDERLADLEEQLGGFERQLDSVAGDWESVEADVAALQEWRSNLASTFESFGE